MSSSTLLRVAARSATSTLFRANPLRQPFAARTALAPALATGIAGFGTTARRCSDHQEETFEEFTAR
ncbi:hypothetical protein IMZ48_32085 [Candidatus Bathyarchaeota archaeon]|nr:hypothetical protein [Candidatus Bathyarchaeota archaeon]